MLWVAPVTACADSTHQVVPLFPPFRDVSIMGNCFSQGFEGQLGGLGDVCPTP